MKKTLAILTGLAGYIHIILFPVLITLIVSIVAYLSMPEVLGFLLSVFLGSIGLIVGIIMAFRILKKRGPAAFVPADEVEEIVRENEDLEQL